MDLELTDRVFIVTGGARGLGRATADCLVAEGARVVLSGRDDETLAPRRPSSATARDAVVADNADPATPGRLIARRPRPLGPARRRADQRRAARRRDR